LLPKTPKPRQFKYNNLNQHAFFAIGSKRSTAGRRSLMGQLKTCETHAFGFTFFFSIRAGT